MIVREVLEGEKQEYNRQVSHIIQSWEWGEFRKKNGLDLVRLGHFEGNRLTLAYQLTFHKVPVLKKTIGYLPKGPMVSAKMIESIFDLGKRKNAAFIKLEPNVIIGNQKSDVGNQMKKIDERLVVAKKALFTKYNFLLDLTQSQDKIMTSMHPKTRYNIGVAQKKGVEVYESTKDSDFEIYLKLYFDTTHRQKYFGHTPAYHKLLWKTLVPAGMARLLIAKYQGKPLVAWMLFIFGDTLYYPYGGSSTEHKDVMASNLVAFEAITLGKKLGLKTFDMWGALGPEASHFDPWYGFHRFKAGYGPKLVEYLGTYDLVITPLLYNSLNVADRLRWTVLHATRR